MRTHVSLCALALAAGLLPGLARAEYIIGLTANNQLVSFDSATPGTILTTRTITGVGGDTLTGIDVRPANGVMYSVATNGNLYSLTTGGAASLLGNIGSTLTGDGYGLDFNPTVDRLRLIGDTDQNLRINPNNAVTLTDTAIGSPGGAFDIVGSAYTNSFIGATSTVLYGLDALGNQLLRSTNPNGGVYVGVGPLGITLGAHNRVGFDISGQSGTAFFNNGGQFYTANLATGGATLVGSIGAGPLVGLTVNNAAIPEPSAWALMIGGFGLAGLALRRRRAAPVPVRARS